MSGDVPAVLDVLGRYLEMPTVRLIVPMDAGSQLEAQHAPKPKAAQHFDGNEQSFPQVHLAPLGAGELGRPVRQIAPYRKRSTGWWSVRWCFFIGSQPRRA